MSRRDIVLFAPGDPTSVRVSTLLQTLLALMLLIGVARWIRNPLA